MDAVTGPRTPAGTHEASSPVRDRSVERKLRGVWRRERLRSHLRGGSYLAAWAVGLFLASFLVDWVFTMPFIGRLLLLAGSLFVLGTVVTSRWWRFLRRYDRMLVATKVERKHPELMNLLTSYVEISWAWDAVLGSSGLKRIVSDQAVDAARPMNFREIVSFGAIGRVAGVAVGAILILCLVTVVLPEHTGIFVRRMRGMDIPYPTKTRIVEVTGDRTMKRGESLALTAKAEGVVPLTGILRIKLRDMAWQAIGLARAEDDTFIHGIDSLRYSFQYYFDIGDARTEVHSVTVVPPPGIVRTKVTVRPPAYTQIAEYDLEKLNVDVPEGSEIEWRIECDAELSGAMFFFGDEEPIQAKITGEGRTVELSRVVKESTAYHFRWRRRDTGFVYDAPPHRIYVRPDRTPTVAILKPAQSIKATVNKRLTVRFQAKDDYGLEQAWLAYSVNDGEESKILLGGLPKPKGQNDLPYPRYGVWPVQWKLKQHMPHVKKGDVIAFAIEVIDVRGGKGRGKTHRSQTRKIEVVSRSEYQKYIFKKLARIREYLVAVHLAAKKNRQAVAALSRSARRFDKKQRGKNDAGGKIDGSDNGQDKGREEGGRE